MSEPAFDVSQLKTSKSEPKTGKTDWSRTHTTELIEPVEVPTLQSALDGLFSQPTSTGGGARGGITDAEINILIKLYTDQNYNGKPYSQIESEWDEQHRSYGDWHFRVEPKIVFFVREAIRRVKDEKTLAKLYAPKNDPLKMVTLACGHSTFWENVGIVFTVCSQGCGRVKTSPELRNKIIALAESKAERNQP